VDLFLSENIPQMPASAPEIISSGIVLIVLIGLILNFRKVKKKLPAPVLWGGISTFASSLLALCTLLMTREPGTGRIVLAPAAVFSAQDNPAPEISALEEAGYEDDAFNFFAGTTEEKKWDCIRELYRNPEVRENVIAFFQEICGSREITKEILVYSDAFDIPPALAFALAWEESRFNFLAVNSKNRNGSIDRGLFQLNNRSFPYMEVQSFFDPKINARYAMEYLRYCLDTGGSETAALAMYNAGPGRVQDTGTPKITLDYIHRIMENRRKIESHFEDLFWKEGFLN
jgi:hypothetical protein